MSAPAPPPDNRNLQYKVILGTIFGIVIANAAVGLRLLARRIAHISLKLDDYLMCCALLFHWGIAIAGLFLLQYGIGLPVTSPTFQPVKYAQVLLTGTFLYSLTIFFTKASILYLYYRVFASRAIKIPTVIVGVVVTAWAVVCCVAGALVCIPLRRLWEPTLPGNCFNLNAFYVGLQIPNVVTDVAMFLIPLRAIRTLPLRTSQKWSLVGVFGVGLLTVIFDIIRLVVMIQLSQSSEQMTMSQVDPSVWTCVEPAVGILAGCLSNMRPILRYLKSWRGHDPSSYNEQQNSSSTEMTAESTADQAYLKPAPDHATTFV